jgi:hypothetical protein
VIAIKAWKRVSGRVVDSLAARPVRYLCGADLRFGRDKLRASKLNRYYAQRILDALEESGLMLANTKFYRPGLLVFVQLGSLPLQTSGQR